MDNYEIARDRAQHRFLGYEQAQLIDKWNLQHDRQHLYVEFFGKTYAICRKTGQVLRWDGTQAGFSEVLSIFDLLCHGGQDPFLTGRFAPVNSLRNAPKAGGVTTPFYKEAAGIFDRDPLGLKKACLALGGTQTGLGDMGFQIPIFADLSVILKFYHSDEEFPPSVTLLWEENTLEFMYYETVFYVAGFLMDTLVGHIRISGAL